MEDITWPLAHDDLRMRRAQLADVPSIVALLADDVLGAQRETSELAAYERAFTLIDADPNQLLAVVNRGGEVMGTCQLTFTPGLSRGGMLRLTIEAVRIDAALRGQGVGEQMIAWAIERGRERGAGLVQLTSDKNRVDAVRFYERLGFVASHEGLKLAI